MAPSVSRDVEELAAQFGLRPTRLLQAGPGRSTVQVRDDDGSLFVLKTATDPGALAGDVDANLTLSAAGLPVPEIIDHRVGPPSVLLLRWIEGDPISSASSVRTQREVGRLLRAVHTLPGAPPFSGQPTIAAWICAWTAEVAAWWPSVGAGDAEVQRLLGWLDQLEPVLAAREGRLTLFDGRAEHFLVRDGRVVGLIDLHDVGPGDPAMDLAVIGLTDDRLIREVLNGYGADHEEDPSLRSLIPFYLLLRRLAGAEWQLRNGSSSVGTRLLQLATRQAPKVP
ncbi:MAG TPA: phosphotransferase [Microlunatus sp.]|nr:phosphotransferase [Microlunatus sp.]